METSRGSGKTCVGVVRSLLLDHQHGDTSVKSATFRGGVIAYGILIPISLGAEAVWGDAHRLQLSDHAIGSVLRERQIMPRIASVIGVATNRETNCRTGLEDYRDVVELLSGLRL